jgi:hypothetical protein
LQALPWYTHVREPLTNASLKDSWFLPFKPGGSLPGGKWHVPDCDKNYNPPLCSDRYHDQVRERRGRRRWLRAQWPW